MLIIKPKDISFYNHMKELGVEDNKFSYVDDHLVVPLKHLKELVPKYDTEHKKQQRLQAIIASAEEYKN